MIRSAAALVALLSMSGSMLVAQTGDAKPQPAKSKRDPDAVRCIKTPIIGTLAQFQKTCMTNREWDRTRSDLQRMRDPSSCPSGQCGGS